MEYKELVRHFGGLSKAARKLGITRQTVYAWNQRNRIPSRWQVRIERISKGELLADAESKREVMEMVAYVNGQG